METPRGVLRDQAYAGVDRILIEVAQRVVAAAPGASACAEAGLLGEALQDGADFALLESRLRAAFTRVRTALGARADDDSSWTVDGSIGSKANAFFWCALRWTFESDVVDVEVGLEWAEEILAAQSSAEQAGAELCALIRRRAG